VIALKGVNKAGRELGFVKGTEDGFQKAFHLERTDTVGLYRSLATSDLLPFPFDVSPAPERFLQLVSDAFQNGTLVKLTLGKPSSARQQPDLENVFVRPVVLKAEPHFSFVFRHTTRDITKNLPIESALASVRALLGHEFLDAHLFTPVQTAQFETSANGKTHLRVKTAHSAPPIRSEAHDREKARRIPADAPWLQTLGVTTEHGRPREGMASKLRQIEKFAEVLQHLLQEAGLLASEDSALTSEASLPTLVDMGCGKGYLTFAAAALLGPNARVVGIETRAELIAFCNQAAQKHQLSQLSFLAGEIATASWGETSALDILVALHACDTATDDALARGIHAGAKLILVSPCCQKELRPQLTPPEVLREALSHGIFQERQAEFVTDALRAQLLEWAGYRTKVFEFISTEHTAKNIMIAAIRSHPRGDSGRLQRLRSLASFYGIRHQRLAHHLQLSLV